MEQRARPSSRDVAKVAGVSANTVSLVMRDSPRIGPATKARVREAIDRLGYRPHAAASALRSTRSRTLGFLVAELRATADDVFRHQLVSAITMRARAADHYLLVDTFVEADRCLSLLNGDRIDGAVVDWLIPDAVLADLVARGMPVVVAGRDVDNAGDIGGADGARGRPVSWVKADEEDGAYRAGRHLLDLGHRRLALLAAGDERTNDVVRARLQGFARALGEEGLPLPPDATARGDWTFESGYALGRDLLARRPRPTALFALNELMAAGMLRAARELGLRVPDDLSVVAVEDNPLVDYVCPRLTAVHVPMHGVGAAATEALLALLDEPDTSPGGLVLPTALVVRESSGPCPEGG